MKNLCYLFLLLCTSNIYAQQWLNCTNGFNVRDGVEQGEILWLATKGGLVEKNMNTGEMNVYNRGNSPIPSNDVQSIGIDEDDKIWISTNRGSAIFDGTDWVVFYDKSGLIRINSQNQIVIAKNDSLHVWNGQEFESEELYDGWYELSDIEFSSTNEDRWLSYYTFGIYNVYHYDNQGVTIFNNQNSPLPFESPGSNPLLLDHQNRLWAGNNYGLFRYDGTDWLDLSVSISGFPSGDFSALDKDDAGNIWGIVNNIDGRFLIKIMEDDSFESYPLPSTIDIYGQIPFLKVSATQESVFYIGTSINGLWKFDLTEWTYINTSLSERVSNSINQIYIDDETTYVLGGQIAYNDPPSMFAINENGWIDFNDLNNSPTNVENFRGQIVGRHMDSLWIYTGDTLLAYVDGTWTLPQFPDLLDDVIEANSFSYHEPNGNRWLLEKYQSYIFYQSNQGWEIFDYQEHGAASGIYESYFTHSQTGDFWLASANGISHYDGTSWTFINPIDYGMISNWVYDLELDENGVIWGVARDAIFKIENDIPVVFETNINNTDYPLFRSLEFDAQGKMWVGFNSTVARLDDSDWMVLDYTNSGVPNGRITELEFDHTGTLWIGSSDGGFAVYNENGLPDYFNDEFHTATVEITNNEEDFSVLIYPNPIAKDNTLKIEITSDFSMDKNSNISIYNKLGQLVLALPITASNMNIPLHRIGASGVYVLEIKIGWKTVTKKIIIH